MAARRPPAALFDVDRILVDTNYHHALAWSRAFGRCGLNPPVWRIHRAIGMGGDNRVSAVAGESAEHRYGDLLRAAWAEEYEPFLNEVRPVDGARRGRVVTPDSWPARVRRCVAVDLEG
jgi:beta-phosphoglucomutase-like phosphatase (HAD superfamily)